MLSTDELVRGVMASDAEARVQYRRDCELDSGEEEDEYAGDSYACDWSEVKRTFTQLHDAFTSDDSRKILMSLDTLDEFIRHSMGTRYPGLYEEDIPSVLLTLAAHQSVEIREYSLMCLTNLAALDRDLVDSLSDAAIASAVAANAEHCTAGHLFRFLSNVLQKRPTIWATLDVDALSQAAESYCAADTDSAAAYLWYRVTQQCPMSLDTADRCADFAAEFLKRKLTRGLLFVYLAVHNLLNSLDIPFECRIQLAERLFLCEIIDDALRKADKRTLTPMLTALYAILGDLFALQLTQSTIFLSHQLDLLHSANPLQNPVVTVDWCEIEMYWAIVKVAENSDARTLQDLLRWRNRMLATDLAMRANDGPGVVRFLTLRCLTFCLERVSSEELIMTISGNVMMQLIIAASQLKQLAAADVLVRIVRCVVDCGTKELLINVIESFKRCGGLEALAAGCEPPIKERFQKISAVVAASPVSPR